MWTNRLYESFRPENYLHGHRQVFMPRKPVSLISSILATAQRFHAHHARRPGQTQALGAFVPSRLLLTAPPRYLPMLVPAEASGSRTQRSA